MPKMYRVSSNEYFNLQSMLVKMENAQQDMYEGIIPWNDEIDDRVQELNDLIDKAPCGGALVDGKTLGRIREITAERELIRYHKCIEAGMSDSAAGYAFGSGEG